MMERKTRLPWNEPADTNVWPCAINVSIFISSWGPTRSCVLVGPKCELQINS